MGAVGRGIRIGVSYPAIAGFVEAELAILLLASLGGLAIDVLG
jgi:hypothetical protein